MARALISCALLVMLTSSALAVRQAPTVRGDRTREIWSDTISPDLAASLATRASPTVGDEMLITDDTTIHLDGQPCRYRDVPGNAVIESVRLAPDNKTIQAIRFRSKR